MGFHRNHRYLLKEYKAHTVLNTSIKTENHELDRGKVNFLHGKYYPFYHTVFSESITIENYIFHSWSSYHEADYSCQEELSSVTRQT